MTDVASRKISQTLFNDLISGLVIFLVALPLCLGIALASGAPLFSGILAGIIGGLVVGSLSGSHTSVSGPAAGLTAVVSAQIALVGGEFQSFLTAVFLAGLFQLGLGLFRAGSISDFFPTCVIKGLLAAIGLILILKQIPHLFGHDDDPEGEMSFHQPDEETTFSELYSTIGDLHWGAACIGLVCITILYIYDGQAKKRNWKVPGPLLIVIIGTLMKLAFDTVSLGSGWQIEASHLVQIPVAGDLSKFTSFLQMADFSALGNSAVYTAAITIAIVASLETLLNLEAVDKLDPQQRESPPNRELMAQGVGNMVAGLVGAIPVTSVIIRSSVNIDSGGKTKLAAVFHGILLLFCGAFLPQLLNQIPLSCLAAILIITGIKLASPKLIQQMWRGGSNEFIPFVVTTLAIVFTDLLIGILIGLGVSVLFILRSNLERPLHRVMEQHVSGNVLRIQLANQVSFLNRAAISRALHEIEDGTHVLIDGSQTDYIDPDVRFLIQEFEQETAPAHNISVSLTGFRDHYEIEEKIQFVDFTSRDIQEKMSPQQALQLLLDGNERFRNGQQLKRNLNRQVVATAQGQYPLSVVLSCIDSRTPAEVIFDMGIGDIFSVRVAGNVISPHVLGSMEYGCAVAGSHLLLVVGHTNSGPVSSAVELTLANQTAREATNCEHIDSILTEVHDSITDDILQQLDKTDPTDRKRIIDEVAKRNVLHTVETIRNRSTTLRKMELDGRISIVGAMYDINTGEVKVLTELPSA